MNDSSQLRGSRSNDPNNISDLAQTLERLELIAKRLEGIGDTMNSAVSRVYGETEGGAIGLAAVPKAHGLHSDLMTVLSHLEMQVSRIEDKVAVISRFV